MTGFVISVLSSLVATILFELTRKIYTRLKEQLTVKAFKESLKTSVIASLIFSVTYFFKSPHLKGRATKAILYIALFTISLSALINPTIKVLAPSLQDSEDAEMIVIIPELYSTPSLSQYCLNRDAWSDVPPEKIMTFKLHRVDPVDNSY